MNLRDADLPDAGEGMCCLGAAVYGPSACTCWKPIYSAEQLPPRPGAPMQRRRMCRDCAFRPGSPERSGDARYRHSGEDGIGDLVYSSATFACHVGMRRVVALVHPSGVRVELGLDDYEPTVVCGVAYKADGTQAGLCAGVRIARAAEREEAA